MKNDTQKTREREPSDALAELSRAISQIVYSDLFLSHVASSLDRSLLQDETALSLLVTSKGYGLAVSEHFLELSENDRRVAVEHELLHLVFRHPHRALSYQSMNIEVFGIACDLVVNQYLGQGAALPSMVTIYHFTPAFPQDLSVENYYNLLESQCSSSKRHRCHASMPNWASECLAATASKLGNHSPNAWAKQVNSLTVQLAEGAFNKALMEATVKLGRTASIGRFPGHLTSELWTYIVSLEGTLDWRTVLRRFSASSRKSRIKNTMRRPSKRYGTYPGIQKWTRLVGQ